MWQCGKQTKYTNKIYSNKSNKFDWSFNTQILIRIKKLFFIPSFFYNSRFTKTPSWIFNDSFFIHFPRHMLNTTALVEPTLSVI